MVDGYGAMSLEDWMGWLACTAYDGGRTEFPVLFENKPGQADPAAAPCRWDIDICGGHSEAGDAYGRSSGVRRAGVVQPGVWGREEDAPETIASFISGNDVFGDRYVRMCPRFVDVDVLVLLSM